MAISLRTGSMAGTGAASAALNCQSGDYVLVISAAPLGSAPTASSGVSSFARVCQSPTDNDGPEQMEIWAGVATAAVSSGTVSTAAGNNIAVCAFEGASTTNPLDDISIGLFGQTHFEFINTYPKSLPVFIGYPSGAGGSPPTDPDTGFTLDHIGTSPFYMEIASAQLSAAGGQAYDMTEWSYEGGAAYTGVMLALVDATDSQVTGPFLAVAVKPFAGSFGKAVNVTTEGSLDWLGLTEPIPNPNSQVVVNRSASPFAAMSISPAPPYTVYGDTGNVFSWTNGTLSGQTTGTNTLFYTPQGDATITAPASTTDLRTLRVYIEDNDADAISDTISLSDSSAANVTANFPGGNINTTCVAQIVYRAGTANATVSMPTKGEGNAYAVATLNGPTPPVAAGAPTVSGIATTTAEVAVPALTTGATSSNVDIALDDSGSPGTYSTSVTGATPGANAQITGLTAATWYWARITEVNAHGTNSGSGTRFETLPQTPSLTAAAGDNTVKLTASSPGATGYTFQRSPAGAGTWAALATDQASGTYVDNTAVNGTAYDYRASAQISGDVSAWSGTATVSPEAPGVGRRYFSTGALLATIGTGDNQQQITVADIQSADIEHTWQEKTLYTDAGTSLQPQAIGYAGGVVSLKIGTADFSADALQFLAAIALNSDDPTYPNQTVVSAQGGINQPVFAAVFTGYTGDGKKIIFTYNQVKASGLTMQLKNEDFSVSDFTCLAIPDNSGNLGTVQMQN